MSGRGPGRVHSCSAVFEDESSGNRAKFSTFAEGAKCSCLHCELLAASSLPICQSLRS